MTNRLTLLIVSVPCFFTALCYSGLVAREEVPLNWKSLELRYASANLELAQARLAQAESQNKLASDTITPDTIAMLKAGVKLTQDQLTQLQGKGNGSSFAPEIAAGKELVASLVNAHNESLQANKLQPGAVADPQLRREKAEIDVATARLAALNALAQQPFEVRMDWQVSRLQDDVRALWARPLIQD